MEKTKIQTIDIKGKKYATVDSRVEFFRTKYPTWSLETEYPVLDLDKGVCICRAIVKDENGKIMSDGYAHEWQSKPGSMVNKTSYIENAQTSAVGRALGFIGIGINGMGIATAEEVSMAIEHQKEDEQPSKIIKKEIHFDAPVIDDEIPFQDYERAPYEPTNSPDGWMSVNAFSGEMQRCKDVTQISRLLNSQKGNPKINELVPLASARKQEILDNMQMGV